MKAVLIAVLAAIGFAICMITADVWMHDQTLREAWNNSPHQFWQALGALVAFAWQYKLVTIIIVGFIVTILLMREVPEVKNR